MRRALLYHGSLVVCGFVLAAVSVPSLVAGEFSVSGVLMAVGGVGMILASGYEQLANDDPAVPETPGLVLVAVFAALALLAWGLSLL
ncbi:hypothetical protein [Haloarchaeobius iranensis]|uniref:Uncharacterized protein n=1 Tax=Haloarchaeobius iranensis TaxID=996166 RepID=A0A1H0BGV2_9EURY|nr:hypothetical protein [Haloarchaeobius iranensis]SDN44838.1 hypothetical protein SAMN05192554_1404 [Haloarchaeobius iranensis]